MKLFQARRFPKDLKQAESELPAKYNKKVDLDYRNSIKELPKPEKTQGEIQCKSN